MSTKRDEVLNYLRSKMEEQNPPSVSQEKLDIHSSKQTTHGESIEVGDFVYFFFCSNDSGIRVITFVERELEYIAEHYHISSIDEHILCSNINQ